MEMYRKRCTLPEPGEPLVWSQLQAFDLAELKQIGNLIGCTQPKRDTIGMWKNKVMNMLQSYFDLHCRPTEHPTDTCGACGKAMPWRAPGTDAFHRCDLCGKSVHAMGVTCCSRIVVETEEHVLYFCGPRCHKEGTKKRRNLRKGE